MPTDLCATHNLAIAPDGKCVLCRRPAISALVLSREDETLGSRLFTTAMLLGLLATLGGLIFIARTPAGHQGGRYVGGLGQLEEPPERSRGSDQIGDVSNRPEATAQATQPTDLQDSEAGDAPTPGPAPDDPALISGVEGASPDDEGSQNDETLQPEGVSQLTTAQATQKLSGTNVASAARIPKEALAEARKQVEVKMFAAPWCYICDRSRDFLSARDVILVEYDIDQDPEAFEALKAINPAATIPTFEIRKQQFVGFHPWDLEDAVNAAARAKFASR